jgi:hypothetical protein
MEVPFTGQLLQCTAVTVRSGYKGQVEGIFKKPSTAPIVLVLDFNRARKDCRARFGPNTQTGEHTALREQLFRARARWGAGYWLLKRSVARINSSVIPGLSAAWPASFTITNSERGHRRCSFHAVASGA